MRWRLLAIGLGLLTYNVPALAWEWRGEVGLEGRYFTAGPGAEGYWHNSSAYLQGQLLHEWNDRRDLFTFTPFFRVDENDPERTHGDIRELIWIHVADQWESRIGIGKVFWGVTEGRHLVDIINQTDAVEQQDLESKLGQPMINLSTVRSWGTLDFYVLPGFRPRTYAGVDGRPSLPLPVEADAARYASSAEENRIDGAVRWQHMFGRLQLALSHFSGTGREPLLFINFFELQYEPYYPVIEQSGIELQYLLGGWLFKAEAIRRSGNRFEGAMRAADVGFEFTQPGLWGTGMDLGWIVEYLWEDRDDPFASALSSDVLLGNRMTFNDIASTELLWGLIWDPDTGERIYTLESSRRFGSQWRATLEGQFYSRVGRSPLSLVADEDMIQLEVIRYF
ncbi:hypothetical protein [Alcanivorax sp. 1008]|uniref:hypothetical protein n=1 Tax=Alcanivorax sp. 1008 TaxID=2816853 RepID=UPI001D65AB7A|nr:hypothetical protein [Alcanivorax sp. 1008]MCC1497195.1 hypothetical protein [Alcanivorax sp. 1008]